MASQRTPQTKVRADFSVGTAPQQEVLHDWLVQQEKVHKTKDLGVLLKKLASVPMGLLIRLTIYDTHAHICKHMSLLYLHTYAHI